MGATDSTAQIILWLLTIVGIIIPFAIVVATFLTLKKRRRAERIVIGMILATAYSAIGSSLTPYFGDLGFLVSLFGEGSHRWLQFWPYFVALLIVIGLLWMVAARPKSYKWQLAPYIVWFVAMIASSTMIAKQQITTFYYNEGSRLNPAMYTDLFWPLLLLIVVVWLVVRRKFNEIAYITILLVMAYSIVSVFMQIMMLTSGL